MRGDALIQTTFQGRAALTSRQHSIDFTNPEERIGITLNGARELQVVELEKAQRDALKEWRDACTELTVAQLARDADGEAIAKTKKDDAERRANEASARLADIALAKRVAKHIPRGSNPIETIKKAAVGFSWATARDLLQSTGDPDGQDLAAKCNEYSSWNRFFAGHGCVFRALRDEILAWADAFKPEELS